MSTSAKPEPLKVSCTDSNCDADLHCFRPEGSTPPEEVGKCRDCGADLVDWQAVHKRDISQVDKLFAELPKELIRHHYWHFAIPQQIVKKANRWNRDTIAKRTRQAVHARVGPPSSEIFRDGTQTPMEHGPDAQIYFLGMHATACCCRKCMEYWHGIPREQRLTAEHEAYFAALVWLYVCQRIGWQEDIGLLAPS